MVIKTALGREFPVAWVGVSSGDNYLRFELIMQSAADVFAVFTNPKETEVLTYILDRDTVKQYNGFTEFMGMNMVGGNIIVAMGEKK